MWGKSLLDESSPNFLGIYAGAGSTEAVRRTVERAAVLATAGVQFTDLVSGFLQPADRSGWTIDIAGAVDGRREMFASIDIDATRCAGRHPAERGISSHRR